MNQCMYGKAATLQDPYYQNTILKTRLRDDISKQVKVMKKSSRY